MSVTLYTQLLIAVIEKITQQNVHYLSPNVFTVDERITVEIKEEGYLVTKDQFLPQLRDFHTLVNMILVCAIEDRGFEHYRDYCLDIASLHSNDILHINRLVRNKYLGPTPQNVYEHLLFLHKAPEELAHMFNVKQKLIKSIRAKNRKAIATHMIEKLLLQEEHELKSA